MNYCPLNIQTGYSFLSSAIKVDEVFKYIKELGYLSFGINDEAMYAYSSLYEASNKNNLNPIYGATINVKLTEKINVKLSLYIANEVGYRNLVYLLSSFKMVSISTLNKYKEGLIGVLSPLANYDLLELIKNHKFSSVSYELNALSANLLAFYLGVEIYSSLEEVYATTLREFALNHDYKLVAFNKHLYFKKEDAIAYRILDAIKNNYFLPSKEESGPYYFLKEDALKKIYQKDEIDNTAAIYNACKDFKLIAKRGRLLEYTLEDKKSLIFNRAVSRLKELHLDDSRYLERVNYELDVIEKMGYLDYFLIVEDYVNHAKEVHIDVGPGRGSAAGSLISYLLGITEVDPIKYDLYFERFLNPERTTMPDIDCDFASYGRDAIANYVINKYGKERTSYISTFQCFGVKGALNDVGKVLKIDNRDINKIASSCGSYASFKEAYKKSSSFKELVKDPYYLQIVHLASLIEGLPRQSSIHPAGIIINQDALKNVIPVYENENQDLIAEFEGPLLEKLGFLKMDLLSLINLTLIRNILSYVKEPINLSELPLDDDKTFEVLNRGLNVGIFQLESSGIIRALKEVSIDSFNDLVALLALYRPGPMDNIPLYSKRKKGREKVTYSHPLLEPILKDTYGIIVYQEQIMLIATTLASFTMAEADNFRRAISKKDAVLMEKYHKKFIDGVVKNHLDATLGEEIYTTINRFASYGFNKSHAVAYALITYRLAYLKAHYPSAFYSAYLNSHSLSAASDLRRELTFFKLSLALPDFRYSSGNYVIKDDHLIMPFSAIKGLSFNDIKILNEMQKEPIDSFLDYMRLANQYDLKDTITIALINAGAFDYLKVNRPTLLKAAPKYLEYFKTIGNEGTLTQEEQALYLPLIEDEEDNLNQNLENELKTVGVVLSASLLSKYKVAIERLGIKDISLQRNTLEQNTLIAGVINRVKQIKTKKGEAMLLISFQDDSDEVEVVVFNRTYNEYRNLLVEGNILILSGFFREREDKVSFVLNKAEAFGD